MHRVVGWAHLMLQDSRVALLPLKANTDGGLVVLQVDLLACYAAVIRYSAAIAFQHLVRLLMADRAALRLGRGSPAGRSCYSLHVSARLFKVSTRKKRHLEQYGKLLA